MIDRLQLANIGVFPALDLPLDPFTVLVGSNGAGKSTVLKALELVTRWHSGGFEPKEVRKIRWRHLMPGDEGGFDVATSTESAAMYAGASFDTLSVPRLSADSWRAAVWAGGRELSVSRTGTALPEVLDAGRALTSVVNLRGRWDDTFREWDGVGESAGLDADSPYWSQHLRYTPPKDPVVGRTLRLRLEHTAMAAPSLPEGERTSISPQGAGLASALAWMLGADREVIERIEADLARVVPQARHIRVLQARVKRLGRKPFPVGDQVVTVPVEEEAIGHRLELELKGAGRVPAELLSEGTLYALGLLTAIHGPDRPDLLLLDDLDRGLHLTGQVQLVRVIQAIQEQSPHLQVIATTHSPFQLEGIAAGQVRVFGLRPNGTANARRLSDHPEYERWAAALRTEELWANLGEDWVVQE